MEVSSQELISLNYIEKCNLALWLGCLSVNQAEKYSLKQLKKVKEVLS